MRTSSVFLTCLSGIVAFCAGACASAQNSIAIGMSAPLTGPNAGFGKEITEGALAYFKKVNNEGGVQGRTINLIIADDKNDRKTAGENAKRFISENRVVALFGFASATLTLDAIAPAQESNVPIVAPFTGADTVRKPGLPVYLLRASYAQEFEKLGAYWSTMGFDRAAVIHYDDEVGRANFETAKAALAKTNRVAISVPIKRNAPVGKAEADAVVRTNTAAIINTTLASPFAQLLAELKKTNKQFLTSSLSFVGATQLIETAKANAAGVVVAHVTPFPANLSVPVVRECTDAMTAAGYGALTFGSLEACISAKALVEALRRAKAPITRESLKAALDGLGRVDLGGYVINLSGSNKEGASFVDLSVVNRQGAFRN